LLDCFAFFKDFSGFIEAARLNSSDSQGYWLVMQEKPHTSKPDKARKAPRNIRDVPAPLTKHVFLG